MKKTFKYIILSGVFVSIVGSLHWLYDYHYTSENEQLNMPHYRQYVDYFTSEGKPRDRESMFHNYKKRNSLTDETSYCDCVGARECKNDIQLVNTYKKGDFNVNFFWPLCGSGESVIVIDPESEPYGFSNQGKAESCKKCSTIMTITNQQGNIVLTGVDGWNYKGSDGYMDYPDDRSDVTKKQFSNQVAYLVKMPDDFPYLVLKEQLPYGTWGSGNSYYFYTTIDKFKLEYVFGPEWDYGGEGYDRNKGIYTDKDGNYMVDGQAQIWTPFGGWRANTLFKVPYRFNNKLEFKIAADYIKESVVTFTDDEIFRLLTNAKKFSKRITEAYVKTLSKDRDGKREVSSQWPYKLLEIKHVDYTNAHMHLFELIQNGRIDLANEYFYTLIPEEYDTYSILPQSLKTKAKLWEQYLLHLKEKSNLSIDKETSLWVVWNEISDGLLSKELNKYKTK